ncbi:MAG: penicillin acylase family protein [Pyrinomonadaceae bacterium]
METKHIQLLAAFVILLLSIAAHAQTIPEELVLSGLDKPVTVRRDGRGIPYIEAESDADLYFSQGYVTASDRLWQMDLLRRAARGETAEIFGKTTLEEDKRWRTLGFAEIAGASIKLLSPRVRAAMENYSRGVNAYISGLDERSLPPEFRILQYRPTDWKPSDTAIIGKILADALSSTWQHDLLRASLDGLSKEKLSELTDRVTPYDVVLFGSDARNGRKSVVDQMSSFRGLSGEALAVAYRNDFVRKISLDRVGLFAEELAASNNWVISGKRTADGKALLANDPHLNPSAPGIWYLTHLASPDMRVAGVTFPGVPGIVLGHNEYIAWGATNVGPDVQDLYVETFRADGKYKSPSGWVSPQVRKEIIKVRSNLLKTETADTPFDVLETRNGVVVVDEGLKKYALKWTARNPSNDDFSSFYFANRAKNWVQFKDALRGYAGAAQNFVFADTTGNIGWQIAGKIPIRRSGDGSFPYDGATAAGDWTGNVPFDDLPHLYNPREGFIVTANQRTIGTSYKYQQILRDAASPWRARRIYNLLKKNRNVTADDISDIQNDVYNIPLANLSKKIVAVKGASKSTLDSLSNWDGRMTRESKAALLANEIDNCLASKIADQNKPAPAALIRERILDAAVANDSKLWLPKEFANYSEFFQACDSEIRRSLSDPKRFGAGEINWTWGSLVRSRFPHPLAGVPFVGAQFATPSVALSGSGQTPNVASYVSMRLIATPGNWDMTSQVIPLGQSGDPRTTHFADQFEAWRSGERVLFPFTSKTVIAAVKSTLKLVPK